jgi:choline dehydrogenase-like flavoprotein
MTETTTINEQTRCHANRGRSRGAVTLASADPGTAPRIDPGLLSDDRDVADMLAGLRLARAVGTSPALAPWRTHEVFPGAADTDAPVLAIAERAAAITHRARPCVGPRERGPYPGGLMRSRSSALVADHSAPRTGAEESLSL